MKILHYIPSIDQDSGGVGAYIQLLARDLGRLCELHVLTHHSTNERFLENCTVHYIPSTWSPWNNCKNNFIMILEKIRPSIVHVNCCWMPLSALIVIWSKQNNYKVVYSPHGMLEPYAIKRNYLIKKLPAIFLYQKKGIKVADLIHATANTEKINLLNLHWNSEVYVVPNCVQIDKIKIKESWKKSNKILFLSRIHPKKGLDILIKAVSLLKDSLNEYSFVIAGNGDDSYIEKLKELARKLDVYEYFQFIGPIYGDEKWTLYCNADLFILPTYSENFGIVIAEALASGTPVITTIGTPWSEINGSDSNKTNSCGWCVNIGTNSLVDALKSFIRCSDSDLERMGRCGRKLIECKYSSTNVANQFIVMYKKLINNDFMCMNTR